MKLSVHILLIFVMFLFNSATKETDMNTVYPDFLKNYNHNVICFDKEGDEIFYNNSSYLLLDNTNCSYCESRDTNLYFIIPFEKNLWKVVTYNAFLRVSSISFFRGYPEKEAKQLEFDSTDSDIYVENEFGDLILKDRKYYITLKDLYWRYYYDTGVQKKEEFWEKGVLKETKEYNEEGNLIK